ncbi:hypothetical protein ACJX0J_009706, partial [Zea mays]
LKFDGLLPQGLRKINSLPRFFWIALFIELNMHIFWRMPQLAIFDFVDLGRFIMSIKIKHRLCLKFNNFYTLFDMLVSWLFVDIVYMIMQIAQFFVIVALLIGDKQWMAKRIYIFVSFLKIKIKKGFYVHSPAKGGTKCSLMGKLRWATKVGDVVFFDV